MMEGVVIGFVGRVNSKFKIVKYIMSSMYVLTPTLAFEIAENDLPEKMEWTEAQQSGVILGDRWRLPTKEELDEMFRLHQRAIGGFKFEYYWSSEGHNNYCADAKSFNSGGYSSNYSPKHPVPKYNVRLVRNI